MIENAVAQDFGARPIIEFAPEGLRYCIDAPLSAVAAGAAAVDPNAGTATELARLESFSQPRA